MIYIFLDGGLSQVDSYDYKPRLQVDNGKPLPATVEVKPATFKATEHVAADDPRLWGWVIFPPNFRAPKLMELAKWQAWTLKPDGTKWKGCTETTAASVSMRAIGG